MDLIAYADESGTHGNAKYCIVSGYLATPRKWGLFEADWRAILRDYQITDFHSKDFFGRQKTQGRGQFDRWPEKRANELISELTQVIHKRNLNPIGGAVEVAAFNSYTKGERAFMTMADVDAAGRLVTSGAPSRPYQLAFVTLMTEACQGAFGDAKVHFVFDRNHVEEARAVQTFTQMRDRISNPLWDKLGRVSFAGHNDEIGLQAADLHAYLWHNYSTTGPSMTSERQRAFGFITRRRNRMGIWDTRLMEELLSRLTPRQRMGLKALR